MAKSSGVGLSEKYIADDSSKEQLQNFNTAVNAVIDTLDFISVSEKNGKIDFKIDGVTPAEKKANLLKFLEKLYDQALKYETVLDKKNDIVLKNGMKFDEQLFVLIQKFSSKNEKLVDLELELETVFELMNTEIDVLMKLFSGETEDLSKDVTPNGTHKDSKNNPNNIDDLAANLPDATEDIDYKIDSVKRKEKLDILKKAVPELGQNTEKLFSEFETNLEKAIADSKGGDKRKLKRTLEKLKEDRDGFKKEFFADLDKMENALNSGDESSIQNAYDSIQGHLNTLSNTLLLQEKALRGENSKKEDVWKDFNTNPPKRFIYEGFVVGMPIGMRSVVDEWRQMAPDFDYIIEKSQTGLDPNVEYKTISEGVYNYLGDELDSFRKVRKETKQKDGDKIRNRYKGFDNYQLVRSLSDEFDIKQSSIENLNWKNVGTGMLMAVKLFLDEKLPIPGSFREFRAYFKDNGVLASYDFARYGKLEAKLEMYKFFKKEGVDKDKLQSLYDYMTETNINVADVVNARILLESENSIINENNVFDFLCDFDSDGRISGSDESKKFSKGNRVDTGSIMGNQMRMMMLSLADTKHIENRMVIKEGAKTDLLFEAMFTSVLHETENPKFEKALEYELKQIKAVGAYDIDEFIRFLTAYPEFKGFIINIVKEEDLEAFMTIADKVEEKEIIASMDGSIDQVYYEKIEQIRGKADFKKLIKTLKSDKNTLTNVRAGFGKQFFRMAGNIVNIFTSSTTSEALRHTILGALGISSQVFKKDVAHLEYKEKLTYFMDKISANVSVDRVKLAEGGSILSCIGIWFGGETISDDSGDKKTRKAGFNFGDLTLMGGLGKWNQTGKNKLNLQNLGNLNAEAVKRRGIEGELAIPFKNLLNTRITGMVGKDLDYIAGIEQQSRNEHRMISYMLGLSGDKMSGYRFDVKSENGEIVQDGGLSYLRSNTGALTENQVKGSMTAYFSNVNRFPEYDAADIKKLEDKKEDLEKIKRKLERKLPMNKNKISDVEKKALAAINEKLAAVDVPLLLMKDMFVKEEMQSEVSKDLAALISESSKNKENGWSKMTAVQKRLFIKQYMVAHMQGYLAVAKMRRQENLASGGIKRGGVKFAVSISAQDIINVSANAAAGMFASPRGSVGMVLNTLRKNLILGVNFKSYRISYTEDAANRANGYDKLNRVKQTDLEVEKLTLVPALLKEQLKLLNLNNKNGIIVSIENNKLVLTGENLHMLNISYAPDVKEQFSYGLDKDGKEKLIIGNVGQIGTATEIGRDGTELHLFLGSNRGIGTVKLSGYNNTPAGTIDEIGFAPKSVEIGQAGIDDLKSKVILNTLFTTGNLILSDAEKTIIKNKVLAWLDADPENIKSAIAGKIDVSISDIDGNNKITDHNEVVISRNETADADLDPVADNNKVVVEFNYSRTVEVPGYENKEVSVSFDNGITADLQQYKELISVLDKRSNNQLRTLFKDLMYQASVDTINDTDYKNAYKKLQTMADANSDRAYDGLKGFLKTHENNAENIRLIVNEVKGIFATNPRVHKLNTFEKIIMDRTTTWRSLDWPDGSNFNLGTEWNGYKKDIIDEIKSEHAGKSEIPKEVEEGLFGFTAFYRGDDKAMKYSMTALGATRVLGGKTKSLETDSDEREAVFGDGAPFFDNLENHEEDFKDIVSQVNKALGKEIPGINLSEEEVLNLLKNKDKTLKFNNVNYEIKPDIQYLFYLLGECANESFGLKLGFKVDREKTPVTETINGKAETQREQEKGFDMGKGIKTVTRYVGGLDEDNMEVKGSFPEVGPKQVTRDPVVPTQIERDDSEAEQVERDPLVNGEVVQVERG